MGRWGRLPSIALCCLAIGGPVFAQTAEPSPRRLSSAETGCDSLKPAGTDSVYEAEVVDRPVEATRLPVEELPFRAREVLDGRSVFRFVVEASGRVDRCSIVLLEETDRAWSDAVLRELRVARYRPARRAGQAVRQRVYQLFTYHNDGRLLHGR